MPVGLGGQVLYPLQISSEGVSPHQNVGSYDQILVVIRGDILTKLVGGPVGEALTSLFVVAIMAAAMSTADSNLHALSALFTRDIYHRFLRPSATERQRLQMGRIVIVATTSVSLLFVLIGNRPGSSLTGFMEMIVGLALFAVAFSVQLLPMTIDVLFVQRGSKQGAIAGLASGLIVAFCFTSLFPPLAAYVSGNEASWLYRSVVAAKSIAPIHASAWGGIVNVLLFAAFPVMYKRG